MTKKSYTDNKKVIVCFGKWGNPHDSLYKDIAGGQSKK
jgi:hypothetical protein